jgi:copper homeostasis protein
MAPFPRTTRVRLEIAVDSVGDAVGAVEAGADRLEVVRDLDQHGFSPTPRLIREIKAAVDVPVMGMVRPAVQGFTADVRLVSLLLHQAEEVLEAGADGIVFAVLTPLAHADREAVSMLVRLAGSRETVFHRAFDLTSDPLGTIGTLIDLGVTRVLTAGMEKRATASLLGIEPPASDAVSPGFPSRLRRIRSYLKHASGRIQILPCGGVRAGNASRFLADSRITQLHSACRRPGASRLCVEDVHMLRRAIDEPTTLE